MNTSEPRRGMLRPGSQALRYPSLDRFIAQARQLVAADVRSLVVDLSAVDEMDVSAIGALVQIHSTLNEAGGELQLTRAQPWIVSMLRVSGVDRIVRVVAPQPPPTAARVKMPDAPGTLGALATA